jgi:hypothetical protein
MNWRQKLIMALAALVFAFCGLEAALRIVDPWDMASYRAWGNTQTARTEQGDWYYQPGHYDIHSWHYTIDRQAHRIAPHTNLLADCTIAAIGDSFTFGYGVNDNEVWIDHLAREFPRVRFINAGVSGYDSSQILRAKQRTPADGYLYLVTYNDHEDSKANAQRPYPIGLSAHDLFYLENYAEWFRVLNGTNWQPITDPARFVSDLAQIGTPDTLVFYHQEDNRELVTDTLPDAIWLEWDYGYVSTIDYHADAAGNKRVAELMRPYMDQLISEVCE